MLKSDIRNEGDEDDENQLKHDENQQLIVDDMGWYINRTGEWAKGVAGWGQFPSNSPQCAIQ